MTACNNNMLRNHFAELFLDDFSALGWARAGLSGFMSAPLLAECSYSYSFVPSYLVKDFWELQEGEKSIER